MVYLDGSEVRVGDTFGSIRNLGLTWKVKQVTPDYLYWYDGLTPNATGVLSALDTGRYITLVSRGDQRRKKSGFGKFIERIEND